MSTRGMRKDDDDERVRELMALRGGVIAAVGAGDVQRRVGSGGVEDAVDVALTEMLAQGLHVGDITAVRYLWVKRAGQRVIDELRSAAVRYRAAVSVDDGDGSTAFRTVEDVAETSIHALETWQIREMLDVLRGDQRRWAEAYYDAIVSGGVKLGTQPRGLHLQLGWTMGKTNKVAQRARVKMITFASRRASGEVCADIRGLLDAFVAATSRRRGDAASELDDDRFAEVLFHVAGCDDCRVVLRERRRRVPALGAVFGPVASVWHALGDAAAGLAARLGVGGGAAAGGAAVTIGAKTAACVTVVCIAAGGTVAEVTGVLPLPDTPLAPQREIAPTISAGAQPIRSATLRATPVSRSQRATPPPPPPPPAARRKATRRPAVTRSPTSSSSSSSTARQRSTPPPPPPPPPSSTSSDFTPGDLPPAPRAPAPPPPPPSSSGCVPGDFTC